MGLPQHHAGQARKSPEGLGHETSPDTVQQLGGVLQSLPSASAGGTQSALAAGTNSGGGARGGGGGAANGTV